MKRHEGFAAGARALDLQRLTGDGGNHPGSRRTGYFSGHTPAGFWQRCGEISTAPQCAVDGGGNVAGESPVPAGATGAQNTGYLPTPTGGCDVKPFVLPDLENVAVRAVVNADRAVVVAPRHDGGGAATDWRVYVERAANKIKIAAVIAQVLGAAVTKVKRAARCTFCGIDAAIDRQSELRLHRRRSGV